MQVGDFVLVYYFNYNFPSILGVFQEIKDYNFKYYGYYDSAELQGYRPNWGLYNIPLQSISEIKVLKEEKAVDFICSSVLASFDTKELFIKNYINFGYFKNPAQFLTHRDPIVRQYMRQKYFPDKTTEK